MKIWITRDKDEGVGDDKSCINITAQQPTWLNDEGCWNFSAGDFLGFMPASPFGKSFGFTPRKGSCKQYELTLKEIT